MEKPPSWLRVAQKAEATLLDKPDSWQRADKLLVQATAVEVEAAIAALKPDFEYTLTDHGDGVVVTVPHWRQKHFLLEHLNFQCESVVPQRKKVWLNQKLQEEKTCSAAAFQRVAKEVVQDIAKEKGTDPLRIEQEAFAVLQLACEGYVSETYADAQVFARHAGRTTTMQQDFTLAFRSGEIRKRKAKNAFDAGYEKGLAESKSKSRKAKPKARSSN